MTNPIPSAAKAAADEICDRLDIIMGRTEESDVVAIILRHVEPIVRAVEAERDEARKDEIRIAHSLTAQLDQALAKLAEVEKERDHLLGKFREMEGNAIMERCRADRAESRLAQSDALLREAWSQMPIICGDFGSKEDLQADDLKTRISAHLANRGTP